MNMNKISVDWPLSLHHYKYHWAPETPASTGFEVDSYSGSLHKLPPLLRAIFKIGDDGANAMYYLV